MSFPSCKTDRALKTKPLFDEFLEGYKSLCNVNKVRFGICRPLLIFMDGMKFWVLIIVFKFGY